MGYPLKGTMLSDLRTHGRKPHGDRGQYILRPRRSLSILYSPNNPTATMSTFVTHISNFTTHMTTGTTNTIEVAAPSDMSHVHLLAVIHALPVSFSRSDARSVSPMPTVSRAATMAEGCHGSKYAGMDDQPRSEGYNHPNVATAPSAVKMVPDIANQGSLSLGGVSSCGCFVGVSITRASCSRRLASDVFDEAESGEWQGKYLGGAVYIGEAAEGGDLLWVVGESSEGLDDGCGNCGGFGW